MFTFQFFENTDERRNTLFLSFQSIPSSGLKIPMIMILYPSLTLAYNPWECLQKHLKPWLSVSSYFTHFILTAHPHGRERVSKYRVSQKNVPLPHKKVLSKVVCLVVLYPNMRFFLGQVKLFYGTKARLFGTHDKADIPIVMVISFCFSHLPKTHRPLRIFEDSFFLAAVCSSIPSC